VSDAALAIVHVLFLWWFGTGAVLFLDGLPRRTFRWTLAGASVLMLAALAVLAARADGTTVADAHVAFAAALVVWAWNEILFLTGTVTGPRRGRCPEGARGWAHFRYAAESILWHEGLIALSAAAVALVTLGGENQVGLLTFLVLWAMRLSTKLNIFLGVRNLGEEFLPDHLRYLASYFRRAAMNPLFPVSMVASTALLAALVAGAIDPATTAFEATGLTILATLTALAILEHGFLVLPFDAAALWRWGLRSRPEATPARVPTHSRGAVDGPRPPRPEVT
jgi:putative photosynthetic complex assembly protein 2